MRTASYGSVRRVHLQIQRHPESAVRLEFRALMHQVCPFAL